MLLTYPELGLGGKQAGRQTFQVFTGAAPGGSSKNLEGLIAMSGVGDET